MPNAKTKPRSLWQRITGVFGSTDRQALAAKAERTKGPDDQTVYTAPFGRTLYDWTPAQLRSALLAADTGRLERAADICESLMADARVMGALRQRVHGLMGLPIEFESATGSKEDPICEALEQDFWGVFPEDEWGQVKDWAIVLGVGVGELQWSQRNGRAVPRVKCWHPRWLRFDWEKRAWFLTVDGGSEIELTPGDGRWVLLTPRGADQPWKRGVWRALDKMALLKSFAVNDWGKYSEVHGNPLIVGVANREAPTTTRQGAAQSLGDLGSNSSFVAPAGWDVKLVEATGNTWTTFKAQLDEFASEAAIAIIGQNLTSEVKGGSFAAARVHQGVEQDLIEADAESDSTAQREQVVAWWAEFNFGGREKAPWPRYKTEPPEDSKAVAETAKTGGDAIAALRNAGVPVDVLKMAERFGVPLIEGAEVGPVVNKQAPQPQNQEQPPQEQLSSLSAQTGLPPGATKGQIYADLIVDEAVKLGADAMADARHRVHAALGAASDYDELRRMLKAVYGGMDSSAFADLMHKALVLAQMAGRLSVDEDMKD